MSNGTPYIPSDEIAHRWDIFQHAQEIVDDKFTDGREYAANAFRMAQEIINRLSDLAANLESIDVEVGTLEDISLPALDDFTAPVPSTPSIELNLPDDLAAIDEVENAVHDKILHDLQSGGPAIPEAVETAIFNRENERALLIHQDNIDKISAEWARRGFTLPNGILASNITQAVIEYNNKRLDVSRDIAIKSFELSDQNTRFAIDKALQWYSARIETYKAKIEAEIARVDSIVKVYLGEVEVYKGTAAVYNILTDVQLKRFDAQVKMALARADLIIKDAEIDMKNYAMVNELRIEASKAIAGVAAQVVAGALSSVSAGASISASNAAEYSYKSPG